MSCDLSREQIVAGGVASTGVTGWLFSRWSPQDELSRLKESAQLFPDWPTQRKARCVGHPIVIILVQAKAGHGGVWGHPPKRYLAMTAANRLS